MRAPWKQLIRRPVRKPPRVYGARGVVLLALSAVAFCFGMVYVGPLAAVTPGLGTRPLTMFLPLEYWGVLWFIVAFHVFTSAFRVDQSRALGGIAGMFVAWAYSYSASAIIVALDGKYTTLWFSAVVFWAVAVLIMGISALLNPAKTHLEVQQKPGDKPAGPVGGQDA